MHQGKYYEFGHRKGIIDYEKTVSSRENLWDSKAFIDKKNWSSTFKLPNVGDLKTLETLRQKMLNTVTTNRPPLKKLDKLTQRIKRTPYMLCEYGFGDTTYRLLEWCHKNDGYLVTVDMPIAKKDLMESERYPEMYAYGVDRYASKYPHCIELMKHPIASKRWTWVNDDIFSFTEELVTNEDLRKKLFYNGEIDYFYEDAIHDLVFLENLYKKIKPFLSSGSIFTGDDGAPTYL